MLEIIYSLLFAALFLSGVGILAATAYALFSVLAAKVIDERLALVQFRMGWIWGGFRFAIAVGGAM